MPRGLRPADIGKPSRRYHPGPCPVKLAAYAKPYRPLPSARQEKPLRARHLHPVHHPRPATGGLGFRHAGTGGSHLHQGPRHRARQAAHARQAEARRLRPLLRPQPPDRRHRGQGQQPHRRRRHAAGAELCRDARRAVRLQQQRRRLPDPRPHRPAHPHRAASWRSTHFPTPAELWQRYCAWKGIAGPEKRVTVETPYYDDGSGKTPRYYQINAINRTIEAIATRAAAHPAGHGHRHRQDLHRLPDHLAAVEVEGQKTHPVPRRPQHPGRPDHAPTTSSPSARR